MLADELGPDDVAAAQIRSILVEEALRTRTVPRVLRDLLYLKDHLDKGATFAAGQDLMNAELPTG